MKPSARLLEVDGRPVSCPRLVFELLHLLCLHPGELLKRDWLIEQLWPGGQVVADESLTQVLFKLRALLGPRGDAVATVRGQGVRLDASVIRVEVVAAPQPLAVEPLAASEPMAPAPEPSPVPPAVSAPSARRRLSVVATLLAIALFTVIAYALWPAPRVPDPPSLLDDPVIGIDLRPADLHASHEQTFAILRSALAADALGDRSRALALLRAAHDGDEQSPYPAIWLALLNTGGRAAPAAMEWLRLAEERAKGISDALLSAYLALARNTVEDDRTANRGQLRALLDLRPRSWMLRQVLVRQLLVDGELETALLEARRMDYGQLGTRRLEDALGNRASLGDVDAAQKIFDAMTISRSDPGALSVAARLAYSAGNFTLAEQRFAESNAVALAAGRRDLQVWNSIMLSLLAAIGVTTTAHCGCWKP
ncbi:MAG: winged helix-turn-helix domain-containing protein [Rhodanobacteraceae bacterium]|nr:winged helix-turn-helix domain-containing protein [Rhodanobacteraceae bacterium]